ncbi:MAG: toxic anion resistance protein [Tissierellia bacterium]|nr:toxic anion resistance protein [Tissierellia bacterium]
MDREIKLTLDNTTEPPKAPDSPIVERQVGEEVKLTEEEKRQVEEFSNKIDLHDTKNILEYGAGAQSQIASFSEKTLSTVKTKDLGEVGDLLTGVVTELKSFDIDEKDKGLKAFFKKSANKATALQTKYAKVETNVETIANTLEDHQIRLMKDIANLDQMYDLNASYYKELTMYILAGRKRLEKAQKEELPKLQERATVDNSPGAVQEARDYAEAIHRFEKKLHDLDLTRMVSLQMAPQIRMIQGGDTVMVEKIQSTLVNTIPLWKSQMVLALGALHTGQAAKAQREVTDLTNDLLRKNAEALHQSTVETAKAAERSIVDIETIKHTNDQLISALQEVREIQRQGQKHREEASGELQRLEGELKQSLMKIASED